jgi:hypothetical protein
MSRKSFILHLDSLEVFNELTNEQAGILFKAIKSYNEGKEVELDFALKLAFLPFKKQFERDSEKYQSVVERNKNNGSKGGRPKNPKEPKKSEKTHSVLKEPKKADNDNDSVNDNDNKNDNIFSFNDFWKIYPNKTNKSVAEKSFNKLSKKDIDRIKIHLPFFVKNKPFESYIHPHASTYLNQKRFNDEIESNQTIIERPDKWELRSKVIDGLYTAEYAKEKYNYNFELNDFE